MFSWSLLWLLKMTSLKVISKKALVVSDYELKPLFLVLSRRPPLSGGKVELDINTIDFLHISMRLKSSADLTWGNNFFSLGYSGILAGILSYFFLYSFGCSPQGSGQGLSIKIRCMQSWSISCKCGRMGHLQCLASYILFCFKGLCFSMVITAGI